MRTNATPELGADLLVSFLNTLDVEDDVDQLADDAGAARWAAENGLEPGDRAEAQRVRRFPRSRCRSPRSRDPWR